jgi:hypothetical protein
MRFREVRLRRDPKCPLCGTAPSITDLAIHHNGVGAACEPSNDGHREGVAASVAPKAGG